MDLNSVSFFMHHPLEHSKPLFNKNNLLTVHHLYKYCCLLEMFKIIKLRIPIALYSLFTRSNRRENCFITNSPSTSFIYQSSHMWNNCYIDFSSAVAKFKKIIKFANIWCLSNYDISEIRF